MTELSFRIHGRFIVLLKLFSCIEGLMNKWGVSHNETTVTESAFRQTQFSEPPVFGMLAWLGIIWLFLFCALLSGPADLTHRNEDRIGGYVHDVIENRRWFCQFDLSGDVASKPPLYTWLASLVAILTKRISPFALYFPSAISALLLSWSLYLAGRRYFGWRAGFLGALCILYSPAVITHMTAARYDLLFALCVFLTACAAFRSWLSGSGWVWFWVYAALGTLAKGPFAVLLGGAGLAASLWKYRSEARAWPRGSHYVGLTLFLLITAGWFSLAYVQVGRVVVDKMLFYELVSQNVGDDHDRLLSGFHKPLIYFASGFAPWSLFALAGLWRVWRFPSLRSLDRRFERFLFCWFIIGLSCFCIAAHQRSRLIMPILAPGALLAGRELNRLLEKVSPAAILRFSGVIALFVTGLTVFYQFRFASRDSITETRLTKDFAFALKSRLGEDFPLSHFESPFPFQYFLGRLKPWISVDQATALLQGPSPAFIAVGDLDRFTKHLNTNAVPMWVVDQCPRTNSPVVSIVGNRPKLERAETMATVEYSYLLRMHHARLVRSCDNALTFIADGEEPKVEISNLSTVARSVRVKMLSDGKQYVELLTLAPGESRQCKFEKRT